MLNVLASRIRHKGASQRVGGTVLLDGQKIVGAELRKRIAYVMQQDLLFATQTPREAMLFSAMLGCRSDADVGEEGAGGAMIKDLGLTDCADTFCGDEMIRGISGGEKKRTAIGIELVMKPELIFLDEPTSGSTRSRRRRCASSSSTSARRRAATSSAPSTSPGSRSSTPSRRR